MIIKLETEIINLNKRFKQERFWSKVKKFEIHQVDIEKFNYKLTTIVSLNKCMLEFTLKDLKQINLNTAVYSFVVDEVFCDYKKQGKHKYIKLIFKNNSTYEFLIDSVWSKMFLVKNKKTSCILDNIIEG